MLCRVVIAAEQNWLSDAKWNFQDSTVLHRQIPHQVKFPNASAVQSNQGPDRGLSRQCFVILTSL